MQITARKRSLRRLCFYTCLSFCQQRGCYASMHCGWYPSMPCSRSPGWGCYPSVPCRFPGPHPVGELREIWPGGLLVHNQGEVEGLSGGGVYMPTTKGEVEGDLAWGVSRPTTRDGLLRGGCLLCGDVEIPP